MIHSERDKRLEAFSELRMAGRRVDRKQALYGGELKTSGVRCESEETMNGVMFAYPESDN